MERNTSFDTMFVTHIAWYDSIRMFYTAWGSTDTLKATEQIQQIGFSRYPHVSAISNRSRFIEVTRATEPFEAKLILSHEDI